MVLCRWRAFCRLAWVSSRGCQDSDEEFEVEERGQGRSWIPSRVRRRGRKKTTAGNETVSMMGGAHGLGGLTCALLPVSLLFCVLMLASRWRDIARVTSKCQLGPGLELQRTPWVLITCGLSRGGRLKDDRKAFFLCTLVCF